MLKPLWVYASWSNIYEFSPTTLWNIPIVTLLWYFHLLSKRVFEIQSLWSVFLIYLTLNKYQIMCMFWRVIFSERRVASDVGGHLWQNQSIKVKKSSDGQKFRSRREVSVIQQMANDRRELTEYSSRRATWSACKSRSQWKNLNKLISCLNILTISKRFWWLKSLKSYKCLKSLLNDKNFHRGTEFLIIRLYFIFYKLNLS